MEGRLVWVETTWQLIALPCVGKLRIERVPFVEYPLHIEQI